MSSRATRNAAANDNANGRVVLATRITLDPTDLRQLAMALAPFLLDELALVLPAGKIPLADVSRRRGKEMRQWRREQRADECSDPIESHTFDHDDSPSWSFGRAAGTPPARVTATRTIELPTKVSAADKEDAPAQRATKLK